MDSTQLDQCTSLHAALLVARYRNKPNRIHLQYAEMDDDGRSKMNRAVTYFEKTVFPEIRKAAVSGKEILYFYTKDHPKEVNTTCPPSLTPE